MAAQAVNVALGGGGAKGLVHVGVLEELALEGYEIASIVGTSAGALMGALFAYSRAVRYGDRPLLEAQKLAAQGLRDLCLHESLMMLADLNPTSFLRRGLLKGRRMEDWLTTQLWNKDEEDGIRFCDLPFDLVVTVTDAQTGEPLVFERDRTPTTFVHEAVRASASLQGVFRDVSLDVDGKPRRCWDGGTTGNCRFDLAHRRHPERLTIACSLTYRGEAVVIGSSPLLAWLRPLRILSHSISILMRQVEAITLENMPEEARKRILLLRPDLAGVSTLAFWMGAERKKRLFENGRLAVRAALGPAKQGRP